MKFWPWSKFASYEADVSELMSLNASLTTELTLATAELEHAAETLEKFRKFDHTPDGKDNPGGGPKGGLKPAKSKRKPVGG